MASLLASNRPLQRKCAYGGSAGPTGECEECRKKKLQRHASNSPASSSINHQRFSGSEVPSIVHEVLRSPGQPLDVGTRAFMEPPFGHDFSKVRVHLDSKAAESARAVGALAYTVGRDVVFGSGQYAPQVGRGRELLAHELAHVVQQGSAATSGSLEIADPNSASEHEASDAADALRADQWRVRVQPLTSRHIARQADPTAMPAPEGQEGASGSPDIIGSAMEHCKPTVKSLEAVTSCNIVMRDGDQGCEMSLGTPGNEGMTFLSQVEIPDGCYGTLEYVQLVDYRREKHDKRKNPWCMKGINALDTKDPKAISFPAPGTAHFKSADNPGSVVGDDVYRSTDDQFKLWLLWRPRSLWAPLDSPELPRVALAMVSWAWKAKTKKTGNTGVCQTDWTISDDYAQGGTGVATEELPAYAENVADRGFSMGAC